MGKREKINKIKKIVFERAKDKCEMMGCNNKAACLYHLNKERLETDDEWDYAAFCEVCEKKLRCKNSVRNKMQIRKMLKDKIMKIRAMKTLDILAQKFEYI